MKINKKLIKHLSVVELQNLAQMIGEVCYETKAEAKKAAKTLIKIDHALYIHPDSVMGDNVDFEAVEFDGGYIEVDYPEYG